NSVTSRNYYVATNGDDTNPGTLQAPFKTIQHAITKVKAGDTVQIRGGIYREKLLLEDINGTKDNPITFENYPNEEVIISGAIEITTPWNVHEGNIWKTNVDFDVTQLFLDDNMLTAARWPNITKDWDQLDDSDGDNPTPDSYWDLKTSAEIQSEVDQKPGSYNNLEEKHSLSSLGASVEGAVFVRYGSEVVDVTQHTAGESSFEINGTVDLTETGSLSQTGTIYYLTADLDLLDQPREWHYDKDSGELYAWLENNDDPNSRDMEARGYTTTDFGDEDDILTAIDSSFLKFKGITLRTGTFKLRGTSDTEFDDCKFLYSGHNTHMLGADAVYNKGTKFEKNSNHLGNDAGGGSLGIEFVKDGKNYWYPANITWRNCEFAYSYDTLLYHGNNGSNFIIDNCYFHNKPSGYDAIRTFQTKGNNTIRRVTAHTIGMGGLSRVGNGHNMGAVVELTHIYNYHFHGDDAGIQINRGSAAGMVIKNNWIHLPGRNGIRFDGDPSGMRGTAHHNVLFENKRGTRLKGDQHTVLNNLAFDNTHIDLAVSHDKFYGYIDPDKKFTDNVVELYQNLAEGRRGGKETHQGNHYSIVHNNLGDKNYFAPVINPADITNNISRNDVLELSQGHSVRDELRDVDNFDFRPNKNAVLLIDQGTHIPGYTDDYVGEAPDIGPYEYGDDNYWIPGHQTKKARVPIPLDGSDTVKLDADLMWLEGLDSISNDLYFGTSLDDLKFQGNQTNNIFSPGDLTADQQYYWRVDTVTKDGLIKGDVWDFKAGPEIKKVNLHMDYVKVGDVANEQNSDGIGAVPYEYLIGKYEVTNEQYTVFLNSVAAKDPLGFYDVNMSTYGGITRSGINGEYAYKAI
ncbi:MAG: DUF1565 domain-containing protein, partial [Prochlorococcus sp.]